MAVVGYSARGEILKPDAFICAANRSQRCYKLVRCFFGAEVGEPAPRLHDIWKVVFLGTKRAGATNGLAFDLGAFDLDGTVLRRNLRITRETIAALQGLRDAAGLGGRE